ncbi:MAG: hypothetical protein GXO62_04795 [Epsilonproteobacteria bacterium]|nr:hypothetical protein [Campylobacterota bacterium]
MNNQRVVLLRGENTYLYQDGRVVKDGQIQKHDILTAVFPFSDVYHISFKLGLNLSEDERLMEAEKYVFTEAGLDLTKKYKINYHFQTVGDSTFVDAFIVDEDIIKERMYPFIQKYKYIDFLSLSPFVFKEYYELSSVQSGVDVFVYFDEDDSYVCGYKDGEYVFVKALNKFSALCSELDLSAKEVKELLNQKGLDESQYDEETRYQHTRINDFFSQFFMRMNNILNYSINFYSLDKIEKIYFYTPFKIKKFFETFEEFWKLSAIEFKPYEIQSEYDPFDVTALVFNAKHYEDENLNFTIFKRPPPFYATQTGKLIIFTLLVALFVTGDYTYKSVKISQLREKLSALEDKKRQRDIYIYRIKAKIKKYKKKIEATKKEIDFYQNKIANIKKAVEFLYYVDKQDNFIQTYNSFAKLLELNNLKVKELNKNDNNYEIVIYGQGERVANFMKSLAKAGFKDISVNEITLESNLSKIYLSRVSFAK